MPTTTAPKRLESLATLADQEDCINILYYGDPGSGKTTSAASLAKLGPIVVIEAEAGLKRRPLAAQGIPVNNVRVHTDISFGSIGGLFEEIRTMLFDKDPAAPVGVVWDSVTETQKLLLAKTVNEAYTKARNAGRPRDPLFIDRAEWGVNTEELRRLIRPLRDLPIHTAFVTLSRRDQDDDGSVTYGPALTPAISGDLMGYVDLVCHQHTRMVGERLEHWGRFAAQGKYQAKDRLGALPAVLIDPTIDRVIAYSTGEMTVETDPLMQAAKKARAAAATVEAKS